MLEKCWKSWKQFLFHSDSIYHVHWGRFCIYGLGTIYLFFVRDHHPNSFTSHWQPISFFEYFSGPFSNQLLNILHWIWLPSGLLAALGIAFALTAPICFISAVLLFGYAYNFGVVYHSTHVYVMCLGLMLFSYGKSPVGVRLTKMYIVYVFCYCGIQKLFYGNGIDWAFSDSFYLRLLVNPQQTPFALWVLNHPLIVSQLVAAYSQYIIEIFAPLAFLNKRLSMAYFFLWSSFHLGVSLSFGDHVLFWSGIFCYMIFLPWEDICEKFNLPTEPRHLPRMFFTS